MSENSEGAFASAANAVVVVVDLMYRAPRRLLIETAEYSDHDPLEVNRATSDRSQGSAGYKRRPSVWPAGSPWRAWKAAQECAGGRGGGRDGWQKERRERRKEGRKEGRVFLLT